MFEFFGDVVFIIQKKRVEFVVHQLWFFIVWYVISDVFGGEDVSFADRATDDHDFVVVFNLFGEFVEVEFAVVEVKHAFHAFFADRYEVIAFFQLVL